MSIISVGFFILAVHLSGHLAMADGTLCNQTTAITIQDQYFFGKRWYLQIMQNYPIPFRCFWVELAKTTANGGNATADFIDILGNKPQHGTILMNILESDGTHLYFPTFPNLIYQLINMTESKPESYCALLCNQKTNVSIFAIFTAERNVSPLELFAIKLKAKSQFPQLNVKLIDIDAVDQQTCTN
ncbi:hypothetical protein CHUAL_011323 [Chamberlinius hualienensis]